MITSLKKLANNRNVRRGAWVAGVTLFYAGSVMAQTMPGSSALCTLSEWFRGLVGVVAFLSICVLVFNHFFMKDNLIAGIVMTIMMGCMVLSFAPDLLAKMGFPMSCGGQII